MSCDVTGWDGSLHLTESQAAGSAARWLQYIHLEANSRVLLLKESANLSF